MNHKHQKQCARKRDPATVEKQNHETRVKGVLGSLVRLEGMQHEIWRRDTMDSIRKHPEAAPPTQHHCHTPQHLRQFAEWITTYADELEGAQIAAADTIRAAWKATADASPPKDRRQQFLDRIQQATAHMNRQDILELIATLLDTDPNHDPQHPEENPHR